MCLLVSLAVHYLYPQYESERERELTSVPAMIVVHHGKATKRVSRRLKPQEKSAVKATLMSLVNWE